MQAATLVFPHQLFKESAALQAERPVILVEEFLFFKQYNFHRQKILLHRASMKFYENWLQSKGYNILYIPAPDERSDIRMLLKWLSVQGCSEVHYASPADDWLNRRIAAACKKLRVANHAHDTPAFINSMPAANAYFDKKKTYFQTAFYIDQRKQRNILVDAAMQPAGGEWSYDKYNRLKFPKQEQAPMIAFAGKNDFVAEAREYTLTHFSNNCGSIELFIYPTTFKEAEAWLQDFLQHRFEKFGVYEDAMVAKEHFLYHSVLSPLLNTGLLTPKYVTDTAMAFAQHHAIPLNSLEGFIRQVMGWREYIRIVYEREGRRQRTANYWGFTRKIPPSFYTGTTGIEPVDTVIKKVLATGYCHHIERLMVLGNFMLLCEFDPNEVYQWFMEMFIDSYDWVMVPNIYGMTQFADGGLMTTKPYISGSNYILKMSDYKKSQWCATWDGLFWRFMHIQRDFFLKNPRLGMLLKTFDNMPAAKREMHLGNADNFLQSLDAGDTKNTT